MNLRFCSLFAGIGGFDIGFQRAGLEPVVHIEIDAACRKVLAARFPESQIGDDVRAIPALIKRMRKSKPVSNASRRLIDSIRSCGTICGGFPCQNLSVAGLRAGLAGERSGLWHVYRRIVALLRPTWVVIENVPGLLSSNGGEDMRIVVSGLEKLGYGVAWRTLDAQYFDVPQRRERVFIVASLGSLSSAEILFERESLCWDTAPSREAGKEVAGTLGGSSQSGGFRTTDLDNSGAFIVGASHQSGRKAQGHDASEDGTGRGTPIVVTAFNARMDPVSGPVTGALDTYPNTQCVAFSCKDHGALDTVKPFNVAISFRPGASGVRRLTPTETLRLQGFPDDWLDGLGLIDSHKYRMCGNAVNVKVSQWLGKRLENFDNAGRKQI